EARLLVHDGVEEQWVDRIAFTGFDDEGVDVGITSGETAKRWIEGLAREMNQGPRSWRVAVVAQLRELFSLRSGLGFDFRGLNLDGIGEIEVIDLVAGGRLREGSGRREGKYGQN